MHCMMLWRYDVTISWSCFFHWFCTIICVVINVFYFDLYIDLLLSLLILLYISNLIYIISPSLLLIMISIIISILKLNYLLRLHLILFASLVLIFVLIIISIFHWYSILHLTCSFPKCPLRSHSLVCIKNNLFIVGIWPILNKELIFIYQSNRSDCTYCYS